MTVTAPPHDCIRLVTYNIRKCLGLDLRRKPDRILQVLGASGAAIAVLQEADRRLPPRPSALPQELIAHAGWEVVDLGGAGSLGWHGNAILTRGLTVSASGHLTLPGLEPRGAVWAEVQTAHGPLVVVGVHLGLLPASRRDQLHALDQHRADLPDAPIIWAGDFNEWSRSPVMDAATPAMRFLSPLASYPAARPVGPLDRIALTGQVQARAHGVWDARPARVASDHLPVWADLQLS